jgi:uncharacterized membrane protein YeiH
VKIGAIRGVMTSVLYAVSLLLFFLGFHLLESHARMALMTQDGIGLVTVMAIGALEIAGLGYMVVVRITFTILCPVGNSLQRRVAR